MKIIFDYNRTLFNPETKSLYVGAFDLLKDLALNHELFLISRFELSRTDMVKELKIDKFFKEIFFVENKTPDLFQKIIDKNVKTVIVGDRIKGEITLGNKLGLITIWIKQGKFAMEEPREEIEKPNFIIQDISEVKNIIENL